MFHPRTLTATVLVALLAACTATEPTRPDSGETATPGEASDAQVEPSPAPAASADEAPAATTQRQVFYTQAEYEGMSACVDQSETAMHTAIRRNGGMTEDEALNIYREQPYAEANMALVKQVYADRIGNVWDYSVSFFQRCSITQAGVPEERLKLASYCLQRRMIGDLAYSFKANGRPVTDAYDYFAKFRSPVVRQVIDAVYGTDAERDEVKSQLWSGCMLPITG